MKTSILLFVAGLWINGLQAQQGIILKPKTENASQVGDTVSAGFRLCLDTTIQSFRVTIIEGTVLSERMISGNCFTIPESCKPGTKILLDMIVSVPREGVNVRLPSRKYYVR